MNKDKDKDITPAQLRQLYKLLGLYDKRFINNKRGGSDVIKLVRKWVEGEDDFDK